MAKIVLKIQSDIEDAKRNIGVLKTSITELANSLNNISVSKDLRGTLQDLQKAFSSMSTAVRESAAATERENKVQKAQNELAKATISNVEILRKKYANLANTLKTLEKQYPADTFGDMSNGTSEFREQAEKATKTLEGYSKTLQTVTSLGEEEQKEVARLGKEFDTLSADVAQCKEEGDKLAASNPLSRDFTTQIQSAINGYQSLEQHIKSIQKYYKAGTFDSQLATIKQSETALYDLQASYGGVNKMTATASASLNQYIVDLGNVKNATKQAELENTNYHGTLKDMIEGFAKFQISAMLVMKPLQLIQTAISSINETLVETENAVISIKRVLSSSGVTNGEIADSLYEIAKNLGQTFDVVSEIAENFAKTGMSWDETVEATEAAVIALNVAELDATEASEGLIAIMQQFGLEASELIDVIDVLNKTADSAAVTTEELLTALQKTGSYAKSAGLSLNETVGIITALSESTAASGQNIGNAVKSLLSYTTQADALSTFASLSDDMNNVVTEYKKGAASILDVWEQLSVEMQSLSSDQADLLTQYTNSSGLDEELSGELSDIYSTMQGVYDTAGTYRKNYFIALMSDMDGVKKAIETANDAAGYSMKEQETYAESYQSKLNTLQSTWEEMANQEEWLALKKLFVELGTLFLNLLDKIGGLRTAVLALSVVLWAAFGSKIISSVKSLVGEIGAFASVLKDAASSLKSVISGTATLSTKLGAIGLVIAGISVAIGIIQAILDAEEAAKEEKESLLSDWDKSVDENSTLAQLVNQLEDLEKQTVKTKDEEEEYKNIQGQLASIINTRTNKLKGLTEGTEEYTQALKDLAKEELKQAAQEAVTTQKTALETLQDESLLNPAGYVGGFAFGAGKDLKDEMVAAGYSNVKSGSGRVWVNSTGNVFSDTSDLDDIVDYLYNNDYTDGDYSDFYDAVLAERDRLVKSLTDKLTSYSTATATRYLYENGDVDTQEQFDTIVNQIIEATGATEDWKDEIEAAVKSVTGYVKAADKANDVVDEQVKKLENLGDKWDDVKSAIKEAFDTQDKMLTLEEKQQAVLEAQKALEEAKNARKIRVYNEETKSFELVTDEKSVAEAEDNLNDAVTDLNEFVRDAAQEEIDAIESGNQTNAAILEILARWASEGTDETPDWLVTILDTIKDTGGVDLTTDENYESTVGSIDPAVPAYDNGGIASGLGAMVKATELPEAVLNPELTAKILSPTSNAQFERAMANIGAMYETGTRINYPASIIKAAGNTTNTTYNYGSTINGVNLTAQQSSQLNEVLAMIGLVPNAN